MNMLTLWYHRHIYEHAVAFPYTHVTQCSSSLRKGQSAFHVRLVVYSVPQQIYIAESFQQAKLTVE
jgi:hypothetical protein